MDGVFNIMSLPNTIWIGVACRVVWYVLRNAKDVAASIPDQGSSLYK